MACVMPRDDGTWMEAVRRSWIVLAALGFSRDSQRMITGEIARRWWCTGAIEFDDVLAVGIGAAWRTRQECPDAEGGLLRLRVRRAVLDLMREESFAHGEVRPHRRRDAPALAERHCRCGKSLGALAVGCVRYCVTCQMRLSAESSRRYRERQRRVA